MSFLGLNFTPSVGWIRCHTSAIFEVITVLALLLAVLISAFHASSYLSTNSDDLVYPYLFQHFHFNDLILPSDHSNILKFPIFYLQGILPYTFDTLLIVSIGLTVLAVITWQRICFYIFSTPKSTLISLSLTSFILGSGLMTYEITGTTIRNIEYPIALLFMIACGYLLYSNNMTKKQKFIVGIASFLYGLTCAGDSFFIFTVSPAILLALSYQLFRKRDQDSNRSLAVTGLVVCATCVVGYALPRLLSNLKILRLYSDPMFKPHILPINHLAPSITTALEQLLDMCGADIFGKSMSAANGITFFNFFLLLIGSVGLLRILQRAYVSRHSAKIYSLSSFVLMSVALTYFVVFIVYILSDLVVTQSPSGIIVSAGLDRYLSFMPFIISIGVAEFFSSVAKFYRIFVPSAMVLVAVVVIASSGIITDNMRYANTMQNSERIVAQTAISNHVGLLVTGYWYGASTKFWSHNVLDYVTIGDCNMPEPLINNRASWYSTRTAAQNYKSALLITKKGADAQYWQCPDQALRTTYGPPLKIIQLHTGFEQSLWIYNRDLRKSIEPLPVN